MGCMYAYDWFTSLASRQRNIINQLRTRAQSLQLCLTLCDPMDYSPPGSSVHGILQARVLEWGAIAFSAWVKRYSHILFPASLHS